MIEALKNIFLFVSFFPITIWTQSEMIVQKHYSFNEGIPDVHVTSIVEQENGMVWVGTVNGLARFDGYSFQKINLPNRKQYFSGSKGPRIYRIDELNSGHIGVVYFGLESRADTLTFDLVDINTYEVTPEGIQDYTEYKRKCVNHNEFINKGYGEYRKYDSKGNYISMKIIPSGNKGFLMTSDGEEIDLSNIVKEFKSYLSPYGVDFTQNVYFKMFSGMLHCRIDNSPFNVYLKDGNSDYEYGNQMRAILELDEKRVLASAENKPLAVLEEDNNQISYIDLLSNKGDGKLNTSYLNSLHRLSSDSIFAVKFQKPSLIFDLEKERGRLVKNSFIQFGLHSVQLKDGRIIVGGKNIKYGHSGIEIYNPVSQHFNFYQFKENEIFHRLNNMFLFANNNKDLWIGISNGLIRFDLEKMSVEKVYCHTQSEFTSTKYEILNILSGRSVLTIETLDENTLLLGLENGGVQLLDIDDDSIENLDMTDGLSNDTPAGIISDQEGAWISTYSGLNYWDMQTNSIRTYYSENGLPNDEFNRFSFTKDKQGNLYFGGMNGLVKFNPTEVLGQEKSLQIFISKANYFKPNNKNEQSEIVFLDSIPEFKISASKRSCSFEFALSDLRDVDANTFSYRLSENAFFTEKFSDWKPIGRRNILEFDFLPSGTHLIQVRGVSAKGAISDIKTIKLKVNEFFYRKWWFYLICTGIIGSIFYLLYRFRLKQIIEIQSIKTQLSSDLHDDVGSLLSGVAFQMEILESQVDDAQKPLVNKIAKSSRKAMDHMRDVVWAIDSRQNQAGDLIERMRAFSTTFFEGAEWQIKFEIEESDRIVKLSSNVKHELLMIFKEFINNSSKYSNGNKIHLKVNTDSSHLLFYLYDNGTDFNAKEVLTSGTGISNFKYRSQKMKAQFEFKDELGYGIFLKIPHSI